MIADGMSLGVPTLSDPFSRKLREREAAWTKLLQNPKANHGLLKTRSRDSMVTDSAAAASAWGSGLSVNNGSVNTLPDGSTRPTVTALLKERGYRTGLVTTDKLTGATPSGFAANQPSRSGYYHIASQYLGRVDVLLGGGREHFEADRRPDRRELITEFRAKGYSVCSNRYELRRASEADRVLGLFSVSAMPYTVDWLNAEYAWHQTPTLREMTDAALGHLADRDEGFFLMVEGARVDHAAHANDAGALLHEQVAFEDALDLAAEFAQERGDTLIVATSDHGNANPGLNGMGGMSYDATNQCFNRLLKARASFDSIRESIIAAARTEDPTDAARGAVAAAYSLELNPAEADVLGRVLALSEPTKDLNALQQDWNGALSQVLGNYTGIGFTGCNHTADHVLVSSLGPGSELVEGIHAHVDVFHMVMDCLGVALGGR